MRKNKKVIDSEIEYSNEGSLFDELNGASEDISIGSNDVKSFEDETDTLDFESEKIENTEGVKSEKSSRSKKENKQVEKNDSIPSDLESDTVADIYTLSYEMLVSKICRVWTKNPDLEVFTQDELDKYEKVVKAYFKTVDNLVSPKHLFWGSTLMITLSAFLNAKGERDKVAALKNKSIANEKSNRRKNVLTAVKENKVIEDTGDSFDDDIAELKRGRFELNKNDCYKYDMNGSYLKAEDQNTKAPNLIIQFVRKGMKNKEIKAKLNGK